MYLYICSYMDIYYIYIYQTGFPYSFIYIIGVVPFGNGLTLSLAYKYMLCDLHFLICGFQLQIAYLLLCSAVKYIYFPFSRGCMLFLSF